MKVSCLFPNLGTSSNTAFAPQHPSPLQLTSRTEGQGTLHEELRLAAIRAVGELDYLPGLVHERHVRGHVVALSEFGGGQVREYGRGERTPVSKLVSSSLA
jgi:hypothetical protein